MANTVSILSYANTFGDWVVTTNALIRENNDLGANNYIKPTGTLYLNDSTLGLQVANNAVVAGQLQVQGVGSSAYIQNNLRVDGQVYYTNTSLGLTNSGDMVVGGSLQVGGDFVITGDTVYASNTFTLNTGQISGSNSYIGVYRGISGNAVIRWNETAQYWDMKNVTDSQYYRILTTNELSSSLTSTSLTTPASSRAANTLNNIITSVSDYASAAYASGNTNTSDIASLNAYAAAAFSSANASSSGSSIDTYARTTANTATTNIVGLQSTNTTQNARMTVIEAVDVTQNTRISVIESVNTTQNTNISAASALATAAFASSNTKVSSITGTTNQIVVTGTTTPTLSLPQSIHTGASVQFGSFGVGTAATGTSGEIRATNNITAYYSDDRLKTRLGLIDNALDKVNSLNGFYYEANQTAQDLGYTVRKEVGLSAQEVQAILPEIVVPAPIDDKYLTIHYERVVPLLVEAIKELTRQVEELKNK